MDELAGTLPERVSLDREHEADFERCIAECSGLAVRVAHSVLRNREDAEEVAQEAFARAYRRFDQLRDRQRFRAWMVRICWRLALDRQRTERRRRHREDKASGTASAQRSVEEQASGQELERLVHKAVGELPGKLRIVVVLKAMEGHDTGEVARLLGLPEGTVRSRLHRARRLLAEELRWTAHGFEAR